MYSAMTVLLLNGGTKSISQTMKYSELYECIVIVLEGMCLVYWQCQDFYKFISNANQTSGCLLPQSFFTVLHSLGTHDVFLFHSVNPE